MPRIWLELLSLDVVELDVGKRSVLLRFSADSAAGAFTGDVVLEVGSEARMADRLFDHLGRETLRQIGRPPKGPVHGNRGEIEGTLLQFLRSFRAVLDEPEREPMELALARTAGIDFFSKTVSLWGKELPERVAILLRRAASNLEFGHPEEGARDLAKVRLLDPDNAELAAIAGRLARLRRPT